MIPVMPIAIFLIGFTAMAGQIIFIREFLVVFYGNELSIGIILANWLVGGAIGAFLGRLGSRFGDKVSVFSLAQVVLAILLPFNIVAIRLVKNVLGMSPGEIVSFFTIVASSFAILAPVCIVLGFTFSLACSIYRSGSPAGAERIGSVYILEAAGSMAGGVLTSFIFVQSLSAMQIIASLSMLNALAAFILSVRNIPKRPLVTAVSAITVIIVAGLWLHGAWERLDEGLLEKQWSGYDLVDSGNSIYGNVAVTRKGAKQVSFFENGVLAYTVPDKFFAEERVHFALLEHPAPKRVLLVGGGVGGLAEEIIRHEIEKLDYVELDPLVIKMAREHLSRAYTMPLEDDRVSVINADGRYFIKESDKKYDCIIIAMGDPYTAQSNRYYTVEFFEELRKHLNKGGVVSFGMTSSESYIGSQLNDFLSSVYNTVRKVFPELLVIPGDTAYFVASDGTIPLTYDYTVLMERARARGLNLQYMREYYLFSRLSPQKVAYTEEAIKKRGSSVKINYDLRPISYYYDIIFWSSRFRDSYFSRFLRAATELRVWVVVTVICGSIILFAVFGRKARRPIKRMALVAVMAAGFTSMAFQITALISFQVIYGYLFYKLGAMLTFFMAGLAAGAIVVTKLMSRFKNSDRMFILTQLVFCIYPLMLPVLLPLLGSSKNVAISWFGDNLFFLALPVIAGFTGGFQFPLANKIYLGRQEEVGRAAGLSYGIDLLGSCIGALATSVVLIPVLGIPQSCMVMVFVNLAVLAGLLIK